MAKGRSPLIDWVRDLTALDRATRSTRIILAWLSLVLASLTPSFANTARAAASASDDVGLAFTAPVLTVRAGDFHDQQTLPVHVSGQSSLKR